MAVHRLVLEAFVGPCPPGMVCRHFPDRDPTNNHANNLRWGTSQENIEDTHRDGTWARGEKSGNSKLTEQVVREIIRDHATGISIAILAARYAVSSVSINNVLCGFTWSHITGRVSARGKKGKERERAAADRVPAEGTGGGQEGA